MLVERDRGGARPWVLLTNDDGVDSPALPPLLRELSSLVHVRAVAPATECSWTGKMVSRFAQLEATPIERDGCHLWALNGYPADCVNVGVHNLFESSPALVVSGVNIGTNAGLAFLLSSGTVGAAVEGALNGVPSVAFSLQLAAEDFDRWRETRDPEVARPQWQKAAVVAREITEEVLGGGLPEGASLLTVNMPAGTTSDTPRRLTGVTPTGYGPIFARDPASGRFEHRFSGLSLEADDGRGDIAALDRGEVAITPIRFDLDVAPSPRDRRRFERGPGPNPE